MNTINKIACWGWLVVLLLLSGCLSQSVRSKQVFSNAQVLYQAQDRENKAKSSDMEMASYFLELKYQPTQITLSKSQIRKINLVFKKLIYPEEYKLYVSLGSESTDNQLTNLELVLKRAQDIKRKYGVKVKKIQIAYLKNQKPNVAFLRLTP